MYDLAVIACQDICQILMRCDTKYLWPINHEYRYYRYMGDILTCFDQSVWHNCTVQGFICFIWYQNLKVIFNGVNRNTKLCSKYVIVASLTNMLSINMNIHTISIHSNNNRYVLMFWLLLFFQAGAGWISWEIMCAAANSLENANATTITTNKKATKKSNKTFLCCTPSCCFGGGPGPKATKDNNGAAKPRNSRWAIFANFTVCSLFFLRLSLYLIQSPTQDYLS